MTLKNQTWFHFCKLFHEIFIQRVLKGFLPITNVGFWLFLLSPCVISLLCLKLHGWAYFYGKISSVAPVQGTWIKDALLIGLRREVKKHSTRQDSNPHPQEFCSAGVALLLCYSRCPLILVLMPSWKGGFCWLGSKFIAGDSTSSAGEETTFNFSHS